MQYKDLPPDLKDASTYLNLSRDLVQRAFEVAKQLDHFIEQQYETVYPLAGVGASAATLTISIGEVTVWCSETNNNEELTFEKCLEEYKSYIDGLNEVFRVQKCVMCEVEIPEGKGVPCANGTLCDECGQHAGDFAVGQAQG